MIIFVHSTPTTLAQFRHPNLGVLSSPRCYYRDVEGWEWAADNDAFSSWHETRYRRMLGALAGLPGGRFVTLPDVVGDGARTLELAEQWLPDVRACGKPPALVAQDGMSVASVPWSEIEAIFIGGTTLFKMGDEAAAIAREAKRRGLWVHMGRVNSHRRVQYAKAIGCDSIDGTQFSWWKTRWLRDFLQHAAGPTQEMLA